MTQKLAYLLYKIIIIIDKLFFALKKTHIRFFIYNYLRENYSKINIDGKLINFFTPSAISKWRVDTFFTKEPETIDWINTFINNEKVIFWYIGANIGLYSIYAAIKHDKIKVISFEPSSLNLSLLSRNISTNNLSDRVTINQIPLTNNSNEFMQFKETSLIEGSALKAFGVNYDFKVKKIKHVNQYKIYGNSINYLLKSNILKVPNYIKIDVDGIEHLILEGAIDFLDNINIKSILVEIKSGLKETI